MGCALWFGMPEHSEKFLYPFVFYLVEVLTQTVKNGVIAYLSLTITLWIVWCREPVGDLVVGTEGSHLFLVKFVPLSEIIVCGSLKRHTRFCHRNLTT